MANAKSGVLITGCNSGIGRLTAMTVARAGHRVYASMRGCKGKSQSVAIEISELAPNEGLDLHVLELDVTEPCSIQDAALHNLNAQNRFLPVEFIALPKSALCLSVPLAAIPIGYDQPGVAGPIAYDGERPGNGRKTI